MLGLAAVCDRANDAPASDAEKVRRVREDMPRIVSWSELQLAMPAFSPALLLRQEPDLLLL
jgi:hypothetical protein